MSKRFIFFLFIAFNSSNVLSQISTDRPDQTESAVVLSKGQIQIESGILVGEILDYIQYIQLGTKKPGRLDRPGFYFWISCYFCEPT